MSAMEVPIARDVSGWAGPESSVLVVGPPRSGKTSAS